jgi:hypothetical protein
MHHTLPLEWNAESTRQTAEAAIPRSAIRLRPSVLLLVTQSKLVNQLAIRLEIRAFQVVEVTAALADHLEKAAAAVMILGVRTEVIVEEIDPFREHRDLHLRGAGVGGVHAILVNRGGFYEAHLSIPKFLLVI